MEGFYLGNDLAKTKESWGIEHDLCTMLSSHPTEYYGVLRTLCNITTLVS